MATETLVTRLYWIDPNTLQLPNEDDTTSHADEQRNPSPTGEKPVERGNAG